MAPTETTNDKTTIATTATTINHQRTVRLYNFIVVTSLFQLVFGKVGNDSTNIDKVYRKMQK
jgi:hypothetical protein